MVSPLHPGIRVALVLALAWACTPDSHGVTFPEDWPYAADESPVIGQNGMVVSTDDYASTAGIEILEAGGNAVDAAIATSFALAVVNPEAGNIGGGGFMVVRLSDGTTAALDYRERAPMAASRDMYLDEAGELTDASVVGHLAVGVPGAVAGLWEAHRRFGSMEWSALVEPAMHLAEGFALRERQVRQLRMAGESLRIFPATEAAFLPGGDAPAVGEVFEQPDLASTLGRIASEGRDGFYMGLTADLVVAEMERGGGILTHDDLARMEAVWRDPVEVTYRGYRLISMPPTSSGGATLAAMTKILEGFELGSMEYHSPEHVHLLAEAWKRAYADRNTYLADPDFVEIPLGRMISDEYGAERRASIDRGRATPSLEIGPGLGPADDGETTHLSVVDAQGNAVSITTTINSFFGSKVTVAGAGFILNNEMDDFSGRPGFPNQYGLVQGEANAIAPGKRMLSAMTPTIVADPSGELFMVLGSPGGATIITNVFQQVSNVIDFGMGIRQGLNAPRIHHQHLPDMIQIEPGSLAPDVVSGLEAMGHTLEERIRAEDVYSYIGDVQAIMR
ncbi:MAG: gamma-glutamyltransferase, partial [Gemmatimonadetes bacterium]|nr:gamma-glutamyltransferase [Gemmatimonadota bacterium]